MLHQNRPRHRFPSFVVGALLLVGLAVAAVVVGGKLFDLPFTTKEVDRSAPPVLVELKNLAEYHAAQAHLEVTIDHEEDVRFLPSALAGERVQFIGVGTVDGIVDFTNLNAGAVVVSDDGTSVVITLPAAQLSEPALDLELSHVMNRDRGLLNRLGGVFSDNPTSEAALYDLASDKLAAAAAATDLRQRTEDNTKLMLYTLFRSLGYQYVDVRFQVWSAAP